MTSQPRPQDRPPRPGAAAPCFTLHLLDGFALDQDGRALQVPLSVRRLIAFLGVRGRCGRAEIAGTLWDDAPDARAQARLRTVLWRLHQLTDQPLVTGSDALALAGSVGVDLRGFVATARQVLAGGDGALVGSPMTTLTVVAELLPGWPEEWVVYERERLRQLQMHALEAIAMRLIAAERYAEAIESALAAVRLEPLRESATRALILAYLAENNVVEAARHFAVFRDRLTGELGVGPTAELACLVRGGLDARG